MVITKLLVANRGEIARRVFRTCREMGVATVAAYTDPDRDALFVAEADEAVALGPAAGYLDAAALVDAALRSGADAVHPGYGFLAEDAAFAQACVDAGLVFVGPPPEVVAAMGSKLEAKRLAVAAGVPVLPTEEVDGFPPAKLEAAAEVLGWPVLVKASAGGGGRGMRIVRQGDDLAGAVDSSRREATAAFGDGTVFLEPWLEGPRHVEIQVFGDAHGRVVHLLERDCSIQRRHQKVIEEAPAPGLPDRLRERLWSAAVSFAGSMGYVGAGTVEFLVDEPGGRFFFLEMNTRLQVEHPVTECITGLDLVRLQILVAQGDPLPDEALLPRCQGHAVEARLYAEDPAAGFLPQSGVLREFVLGPGAAVTLDGDGGAGAGIRVDTAVGSGSVVGSDYDPMLAKVIAWAPTRSEAAGRLAAALAGMRIHGLRTNRDLLVHVLRHPEFLAGRLDTGFLGRHGDALLAPRAGAETERLHAVAAALAGVAERQRRPGPLRTLPPGWRNNRSAHQEVTFVVASGATVNVGYGFSRNGAVEVVEIDGEPLDGLRVGKATPGSLDLEVAGVRRRFDVRRTGLVVDVDSALGHTELVEVERFPLPEDATEAGSLAAPLAGVVVRVAVAPGARVEAGGLVAVIESMKVEYRVTAPEGGTVTEVRVEERERVEAGAVVAVVEPDGA